MNSHAGRPIIGGCELRFGQVDFNFANDRPSTTNGEGSERVEFCMDCHIAAGDARDHLFFVPAQRRVRFLN